MSEEAQAQTVEVPNEEISQEVVKPSKDELKQGGWSDAEIADAEKRGMIEGEKKEEIKTEKVTEENKKAEITDGQEKADDKKEGDKDHTQQFKNMDLSPEQEAELKKLFPHVDGKANPALAMYYAQRNERRERQRIQRESREQIDALKQELEALKSGKFQQEVDEDGNVIDPDDKPLTMKQLREMQRLEQEQQQKVNERKRVLSEAQREQEEYARSIYPDFDDTVKKAVEVMQNLETMVPEKWKQAKAVKLIEDLQNLAANADKINIDDYNAALVAYEIGQFHPDFKPYNGQRAEEVSGNSPKPEGNANGGLTPEQMKRIEEKTKRRVSSASIPGGGGRRVVAAQDVTVADLHRMNYQQRDSFKRQHPEVYARLLRGD